MERSYLLGLHDREHHGIKLKRMGNLFSQASSTRMYPFAQQTEPAFRKGE
jgi:hypothetical protein